MGIILLLNQSANSSVHDFEVFYYIFVGFLLCQSDVLADLGELFLYFGYEPILFLADLSNYALLELAAASPHVQGLLTHSETTELLGPTRHQFLHLSDCFEFVVFVAPEERAVRTKFHAIVDAYDFQIFLMFFAIVSLGLARIGAGNGISRRLFELSRQLGAFSELFAERNILGKILKVGLCNALLVSTMLAHDRQFLPFEELTQARCTRTVLAVRHHSRLARLVEHRLTEATADFLLSQSVTHLIYKPSFRNATHFTL